ncbi:hypothetical protein ACHQM5_025087 [Ranunculus cassubicifolius]
MKLLPALLLISLLFSSSFLGSWRCSTSYKKNLQLQVLTNLQLQVLTNRPKCAKAGMRDRCLNYCGICCQECNCVPSGTYGNKDECPCYRDMKNSKGKDKCP